MGKLIESQSTPSEKVSDGPVTSSSRAQIPHVHHCAINHRPIVGASVRGHPPAAIGEDDLQHTCSSCSSSRPRMASDEAPPMASPDWPRVSRLALTGTDGNHGFRRWHVTPPRARRCEHAQDALQDKKEAIIALHARTALSSRENSSPSSNSLVELVGRHVRALAQCRHRRW